MCGPSWRTDIVEEAEAATTSRRDLSFDEATALHRRSDGDYELSIDPSWWVDIGPNGGYLAAVLSRAAESEAIRLQSSHRPASASLHYLRPARPGLARVSAQLIRSGRSTTVLRVELHQEQSGPLVSSLFTLCAPALDELDPAVGSDGPATALLPPTTGHSLYEGAGPAYLSHWEFQSVYGHTPFSAPTDTPDGPLVCTGWIRLRENRPVDAPLLAAMADAWAPVIFGVLKEPALVPTLSFSLIWRAHLPHTQWCFITLRTEEVSGGLVDESVEIRAHNGALVLQGRQLAQFRPGARRSLSPDVADGHRVATEGGEPCA